ncbi:MULTISPECIES: 4Fe-4S dicluster domain-containing protein [Neomoorella]|uniref:4Fe-4S dicluster domain-containing protein n=1 Tax=Neomoorella TaxID=44260 RepID=UPI0010FFC064|nr:MULTISPECIES: 4Fe-4S dicluster domain-containing protein [unclassified Moorella (in: firmicutes)]MDK2816461.1 hypothetical protein [Moorella sp. (in: firmicutes)]MDK2895275.1 hypothetical protein [Moorella sp. (in: firmicutes)]GEA16170.1 DMSO reductase subunit B [Moorella sp. E308F]GEA18985.1 DMSO reductase subunit B [Moorella sp. E306M]
MAKQLGFLVDTEKCIGCFSCEMACKNEYQTEVKPRWRRVYQQREASLPYPERNFMSLACNHCADPACLKVCPVGAYSKREDGIVLQDHARCIGCRLCTMACPYGAPQYNEKDRRVEKCQLCYQKVDRNEEPACVAACPVGALQLIKDLNSFPEPGTVKELPGFPDITITRPSVRFVPPRAGVQIRRDV